MNLGILRIWTAALAVVLSGSFCGCATSPDGSIADASGGSSTGRAGNAAPEMRAPRPGPDHRSDIARPAGSPLTSVPSIAADSGTENYGLRQGDPVIIMFRGIPQAATYEEVVDENGTINLPYINQLKVLGMTAGELETLIYEEYVPDYYRYLTVTAIIPTQRSYFIRGEVRIPGRHPFLAGITLHQAITSAGGFSDFAQPKKVRILRGSETLNYNLIEIERNPDQDVPLKPGDVIIVPRSWLG